MQTEFQIQAVERHRLKRRGEKLDYLLRHVSKGYARARLTCSGRRVGMDG
jgi:hypothetical protein